MGVLALLRERWRLNASEVSGLRRSVMKRSRKGSSPRHQCATLPIGGGFLRRKRVFLGRKNPQRSSSQKPRGSRIRSSSTRSFTENRSRSPVTRTSALAAGAVESTRASGGSATSTPGPPSAAAGFLAVAAEGLFQFFVQADSQGTRHGCSSSTDGICRHTLYYNVLRRHVLRQQMGSRLRFAPPRCRGCREWSKRAGERGAAATERLGTGGPLRVSWSRDLLKPGTPSCSEN